MKYEVWVTRTTDEVWYVEADSREEATEKAVWAEGELVSEQLTKSRMKKCRRHKEEEKGR